MIANIRKYISPPIFPEDEEKTHAASLLNTILLIVLLILVIFTILALVITPTFERVLIELFLILITFVALILMHRGFVRQASIIFSVTLLLLVSIGTFMSGGFRGSTMGAYIGIIILSGILLGNWTAVLYGAISITLTGWMVYADFHGMLPPVPDRTMLVTQWGEFASVLVGIVGLLALVMNNLERALERAKRRERELSHKLIESQQLSIWAQEASEYKSHLLARVSHELRTPLGVVMGMAEMLNHNYYGSLTDGQKKLVERIQVNVKYLETTFTEFLEQSQLDKEMLQMQAVAFSPAEILARVLPEFLEQANQKGLQLEENISSNLPEKLWGVPTHIEQVLFHLLTNAIKFTENGSIKVRLYNTAENSWCIQVRDTGIGISKEQQELIFEPFRQVDESISREYGGVGLGLSIVKRLTTVMKGNIYLESKLGQGSSFTVTLPLIEPPVDNDS